MDNRLKIAIAASITIAVVVTSLPDFELARYISNVNAFDISGGEGIKKTIRIGYFPNINHAQAVIGLGNGDFQRALGNDVEVKTQVFNAGPSAIEALFANQIDLTYVGPNPAINGYIKSEGKVLRIIAGASSGGAVFVVRNDSGINSPADFSNKKFASPQLGNTQDVALRKYLLDKGYKTIENGGNVNVLPAKNPDILALMLKKEIDGAWVPEPWGAKLIKSANSKILLDERELWPQGEFVTSNIIVRTDFLEKNPDLVKKVLSAHIDETIRINGNPNEGLQIFNAELKKITGQTIPKDELEDGFS